MEVVIIPWMHALSEEHDKAMEVLRGVEDGATLAIEYHPKMADPRKRRQTWREIPKYDLNKPKELLEGLRLSAAREAFTIAGEKGLKVHAISSLDVLRRQGPLAAKGDDASHEEGIELLRLDVEQEAAFAENTQRLLERNGKVYVLVGTTHADNVAERIRRVEGIRVSVAATKNEDTKKYCETRDLLKRDADERKLISGNALRSIISWNQRRTVSWMRDPAVLAKLRRIQDELRKADRRQGPRIDKVARKRKRKQARRSKRRGR